MQLLSSLAGAHRMQYRFPQFRGRPSSTLLECFPVDFIGRTEDSLIREIVMKMNASSVLIEHTLVSCFLLTLIGKSSVNQLLQLFCERFLSTEKVKKT
jgi:hypothetical protein